MATVKPQSSTIAERLRLAREMAGLTQSQVAELLGLHRPSVSEMEAGRRKVSAQELAKLSELYGVSVDWITQSNSEMAQGNSPKVQLAARELAKLTPNDLERVLQLLSALRHGGNDNLK